VVINNQVSWERFLLGYAVLLPAHLAVNYSNEYFDLDLDRFTSPTQFSGGSGVLLSHPELVDFAKLFSIGMVAASLILGTIFSYVFNSPVFFLMTILGNSLAWFYSAPPLKLSYRGLGEIAMVLTGFLIPGLGYVAIMGSLSIQLLVFSFPIMLLLLLFILSVEIPDLEADRKGGKYNFVVRYGRTKSLWVIFISSALATICFLSVFPENEFSPINFNIIALLSFIPLSSAILALLNRKKSIKIMTTNATRNVPALILFVALVNLYFYTLI
jgi:1,4-dihydroxy-2-naphthoate octaprenyltransferase